MQVLCLQQPSQVFLGFTNLSWLLPSVEACFPVLVAVLWATWPPFHNVLVCVTQLRAWSWVCSFTLPPAVVWQVCQVSGDSRIPVESCVQQWALGKDVRKSPDNPEDRGATALMWLYGVSQFRTKIRLLLVPSGCVSFSHHFTFLGFHFCLTTAFFLPMSIFPSGSLPVYTKGTEAIEPKLDPTWSFLRFDFLKLACISSLLPGFVLYLWSTSPLGSRIPSSVFRRSVWAPLLNTQSVYFTKTIPSCPGLSVVEELRPPQPSVCCHCSSALPFPSMAFRRHALHSFPPACIFCFCFLLFSQLLFRQWSVTCVKAGPEEAHVSECLSRLPGSDLSWLLKCPYQVS